MAEQNQIQPALIVGLGGSGIEIVRRFKRRFRAMYPDMPYVRFLGVDTAPQTAARAEVPQLDDDEFLWTANFNPALFVGPSYIDNNPEIREWWRGYTGLPLSYVAAGAGQRRPVGRLALFVHFREILERLRTHVQGIFTEETFNDLPAEYRVGLNVYVVSSTCGGTGTGMFLDLATMARHLVSETMPGVTPHVRGLLLLPSTFVGTNQIPMAAAAPLQANAYGALTELDYAMSKTTERSAVMYPGRWVASRAESVFKTCYLVGNQAANGAVLRDFADLLERAAIHLQIELASPVSGEGESRMDNILSQIAGTPTYRGRTRLYSSFSGDWLELPSQRVQARWTKQLAVQLLERLKRPSSGVAVRELADLQRASGFSTLHSLFDHDGVRSHLPDTREEEGALLDIPQSGLNPTELIQRATMLHSAQARQLNARSALAEFVRESVDALPSEVQAQVGKLLTAGSLHDARQLVEKARGEIERWIAKAHEDSRRADADWMGDFAKRANALTPSVVERFLSNRPQLAAKQVDLASGAISDAQDAARRALRTRVAAAALDRDALPRVQHELELLRDRIEQVHAVVDGALTIVQQQSEPALPSGAGSGGVNDQQIDIAFADEDRQERLSVFVRPALRELLDGGGAIAKEELAQRVWSTASAGVREVARDYLATLDIPAAHIADRLNRLSPLAVYTSEWGAISNGTQYKPVPLSLVGLPEHMGGRQPAIREAIAPAQRQDADLVVHRDADRVMMTRQDHGFPLFALAEIRECRRAFESSPAQDKPLRFTLPELPSGQGWDLMPVSAEEAHQWFAVGLALGRVRRAGQGYLFSPAGNGGPVPLGDDAADQNLARRNARDAFVNAGFGTDVAAQIRRVTQRGNEELSRELETWLAAQQPKSDEAAYPAEFRRDLDLVRAYHRSIA